MVGRTCQERGAPIFKESGKLGFFIIFLIDVWHELHAHSKFISVFCIFPNTRRPYLSSFGQFPEKYDNETITRQTRRIWKFLIGPIFGYSERRAGVVISIYHPKLEFLSGKYDGMRVPLKFCCLKMCHELSISTNMSKRYRGPEKHSSAIIIDLSPFWSYRN